MTVYTCQGGTAPTDAVSFQQWAARQNLTGPDRLSLSLLVIREVLDDAGMIQECVLERRRGAVDGPLFGHPARVEFLGAAQCIRLYAVDDDGTAVPMDAPRAMNGGTSAGLVPYHGIDEFAGEADAIRAHVGAGCILLSHRSPTLFEEMVGFSTIAHVRIQQHEVGCGIGWHGTVPFVLTANFPRFDSELTLSPEADRDVAEMVREQGLIRHETRLDAKGLCVMARRPYNQELLLLRPASHGVTVGRYVPEVSGGKGEDQRRWLEFAEEYEARFILDCHAHGSSDDLIVLTGDADGQVWQHRIDPDGVELSRSPANETAVAALYRGSAAEPAAVGRMVETPAPEPDESEDPGLLDPSGDSLLGQILAYGHARDLLTAAADAATRGSVPDMVEPLMALSEPMKTLGAHHGWSAVPSLLRQIERDRSSAPQAGRALKQIEARLADELADVKIAGPGSPWLASAAVTFGEALDDRFPGAGYHAHEALRCLHLRRPTASVFHLMHILHVGLQIFVPDPATAQWPEIVAAAEAAAAPTTVAALQDIRRLWRSGRLFPAAKYTEEEAEALLDAVARFIRLLVL